MLELEKFVVEHIAGLSNTNQAVVSWGKRFTPGEDLFAFSETDIPHDQCWVIPYSRGAPNLGDNTVFSARFQINIRSFNYKKAKDTLSNLANEFNGKTFSFGGYVLFVRAESLIPTPVHKDSYGRMIFSIEFYVEARRNA